MHLRTMGFLAALSIWAGAAFGQSNVVTFTPQDIAGLMAAACGPQSLAPEKDTHVHRNAAGNMLYIVGAGKFEALIYAQQQNCNPLSPETLNLWRNQADGAVSAQLAKRYDGERLLVQSGGSDGISGKRFDVEPSGQYLLVSHGESSGVSPVDRPYVRTIDLQIDGQRLFKRPDGLLVVGSNKATNQLEAVPVSLQGGTAVAGAPIVVPGVPAGVQVLDYNDKTDELLLGGLNASGVTSFAVANLSTGQARLVENVKPGATTALFINDPGLLARLKGEPIPAQQGSAAGQQQQRGQQPRQSDDPGRKRGWNPLGWFGRD